VHPGLQRSWVIGLCTGGYGHQGLISAGADCVYDDVRHLMCDLVKAFRLCQRYLLRPAR
jgi:hypothetical protein